MNTVFNDEFIFHGELRKRLEWLLKNPEKIPSPLCFYGEPGIGKTSFAKYLAECVAGDTNYVDMNEYKVNGASSDKLLVTIKRIAAANSLTAKDAVWRRAIILDEWHNASHSQQDAYKVPFESYVGDNKTLFILCLNTSRRKGIDDVLSSAIKSRCHAISFNTKVSQLAELKGLVMSKFPQLQEAHVMTMLPDMRQIQRAARMA